MSSPLDGAHVSPEVFDRHPDYVAVLLHVTGLTPGPTSEGSDALLRSVEESARAMLDGQALAELPEILTWRAAYQTMGLRPRDARSSVEALLRRVEAGLPRINRLADVYNAMSVKHLIPIGGEDVTGYQGPPALVVAHGDEPFDTMADGQSVEHTADTGEIIWRDDAGVTCRRWNWRQCVRTRLTESTTDALFIIDGLGDDAGERAGATADDLIAHLRAESPGIKVAMQVLGRGETSGTGI